MKLTTKVLKLAGAAAVAMIGVSAVATASASAAPVSVVTKPNGTMKIVAKPGSIQRITTNNGVTKIITATSVTRIAMNNRGVMTVAVRKISYAPPNHFKYGYDDRRYFDRFHRPPARYEHVYRPYFARFFHQGHWNFQSGHWVWMGGFWTR